jgi:hypothetical protein
MSLHQQVTLLANDGFESMGLCLWRALLKLIRFYALAFDSQLLLGNECSGSMIPDTNVGYPHTF